MADFTAEQIETITNSTLDFYYKKGKVLAQSIQDKPLLKVIMGNKKTFPGGKEFISFTAKFDYDDEIQGFNNDDEVTYGDLSNTKRGNAPWKLLHKGWKFSMHELAKDGISVVDSKDGKNTSNHSDREVTALVNILEEKIDNFEEGWSRGINKMFWRDGTQDANLVPGLRSFILDDPTSASVIFGIDQSANTLWRNRASLALSTATPANLVIVTKLQNEWRQLRRYGGRPNKVLCGSSFIEAMENELRSKGNFTLEGWTSTKATDASLADIHFKGVLFEYDPTLDDEGLAKYCYILDTRHIKLMPIEGEEDKDHNPARPENKYVFYRARTWMGGLICTQRNAQGVYSIA